MYILWEARSHCVCIMSYIRNRRNLRVVEYRMSCDEITTGQKD